MEKRSTKVYISGKMSGLPEYNFPAFYKMEEELKAKGYEVINPAREFDAIGIEIVSKWSWEECMKVALTFMLTCDAICTLEGWEESDGATTEVGLAKKLKYEFVISAKLKRE